MWLHDRMEPKIDAARERIEHIEAEFKNHKLGEIHLNQILTAFAVWIFY